MMRQLLRIGRPLRSARRSGRCGAALAVSAQAPAPPARAGRRRPASAAPAAASDGRHLLLTASRSMVLTVPFDITRIAITNPAVADAVVVQPREVLIDGKSAGHHQPDRLGRRHAACSTTSRSIPAWRRSSSTARRCSPARTSACRSPKRR